MDEMEIIDLTIDDDEEVSPPPKRACRSRPPSDGSEDSEVVIWTENAKHNTPPAASAPASTASANNNLIDSEDVCITGSNNLEVSSIVSQKAYPFFQPCLLLCRACASIYIALTTVDYCY
jgi:hypothetical protein